MKRQKKVILILSIVVVIETIFIVYLWLSRPKKIPPVPVAIKGKIAIVIDDWGYNLNNLAVLDQIKYPLTVSVLPNLTYSKVVAKELYGRGRQIILHLPLEPYEKFRLEQNTIMTSMDDSNIINTLRHDLASIANPSGVSNHMGSKATENSRVMRIIFKELKIRNLYFLDSLVSAESTCFDLAYKMRLGFAKRDVFLDNIEEPAYIRGQIYKLKTRARVYGQAIGIGHDRKTTLGVLKEVMPELEKEGYEFVFVSELVR